MMLGKVTASARSAAPKARTVVLICLLSLSGCTAGPNFTRPAAPAATRYTAENLGIESGAASDSAQHIALGREIEGAWWTLFGSDTIDQLVKRAVEHNRSLEAATGTLRQAQQLALAQAGSRYPQVSLTAGVGRQQYGDEFLGGFGNIPPFTYFAAGPAVSYTLDYTGGVARSVEQQYALAEVERRRLDAAYLTVTGQAVLQTLAIASARAQIATVETILAEDKDNLRLVQTAFDNGSVSREDIVSAQSQVASDTTLLPPLRQDLRKLVMRSRSCLGEGPADELPDIRSHPYHVCRSRYRRPCRPSSRIAGPTYSPRRRVCMLPPAPWGSRSPICTPRFSSAPRRGSSRLQRAVLDALHGVESHLGFDHTDLRRGHAARRASCGSRCHACERRRL